VFVLLMEQSDVFPKSIEEPLLAQTVEVKPNGGSDDNGNVFGYRVSAALRCSQVGNRLIDK